MSSTAYGDSYLTFAADDIQEFLGDINEVVLLAYALWDMDKYEDLLVKSFKASGIDSAESIHHYAGDEIEKLKDAKAVFIAGGNSPLLVANLHGLMNEDGNFVDRRDTGSKNSLVEVLRERVAEGMPIMGASAGLNVMCKDIRTSNDMHEAVWDCPGGGMCSRLDSLGLFPDRLCINPHYIERPVITEEQKEELMEINPVLLEIVEFHGESRSERLTQVLECDPERVILALREGEYMMVEGMSMQLKGNTGGKIFRGEKGEVEDIKPGTDLSYLLEL